MNGRAEMLDQALHCIANAVPKDSSFTKRYLSELILTTNYLRNQDPIVGRDIKPCEADTRRPLFLGHLQKTWQIRVAQLCKHATS